MKLKSSDCGNFWETLSQCIRKRVAVGSKVLSFPGSFMALSSCSLSHSLIYRVSHPIIHRGSSAKFLGVPLACGPLLQLATAQAGQGSSQNISQTMGWETLYIMSICFWRQWSGRASTAFIQNNTCRRKMPQNAQPQCLWRTEAIYVIKIAQNIFISFNSMYTWTFRDSRDWTLFCLRPWKKVITQAHWGMLFRSIWREHNLDWCSV